METKGRNAKFITDFQVEFSNLLGTSSRESETIREAVRKAVIEQYLSGMGFMIKDNQSLSWKALFRAADALTVQGKQITVQGLVSYIGPKFQRKLNKEVRQSAKNPPHNIDKTPGKTVRVLQGGLTGVGGKHSRRSRGGRRS